MCGIAGWAQTSRTSPGLELAKAMSDVIAYRGPDGDGQCLLETADGAWTLGFAHRRLAIIDPVGGVQPMQSDNGRLTLIFNGEIYNFRSLKRELEAEGHHFKTTSDTEVLLHAYQAWGVDCIARLRGMFAFALWDREHERLVLARDPFGKKPIYLYEDDGRLLFGSEIKSLLVHDGVPRALDEAAVGWYLVYRYVPGPHTLFKGIRKLQPGSYAVWQAGTFNERRYFTPPDASARPAAAQPADPVKAFMDAFDEAVALRMVSDVPFGAFLSGGIDSSAVVARMSAHSDLPIKTFSVGFNEGAYSELDHARAIAALFKTEHTELVVEADTLMDHLPRLVQHRDAPVAEPSDIPIYLLACEARKTVKMVLTGEGSDELLAGYPKHTAERQAARYQTLVPGLLHDRLVKPLVGALPYRFRRHKTAINSLGLRDARERYPRWFGAMSFAERDALLTLNGAVPPAPSLPFESEQQPAALRRLLYFDQTSWLPDNLLERGDRMTMAASIEARMPFMDHELARFVSTLDDRMRIGQGEQKHILRAAMRRILPDSILNRPKVGFRVPVNEWFQTSMRDYLYDHLLGADSRTRTFYDRGRLQELLDAHSQGRQNHEKVLWTLINLELFQRAYALS